MITFNANQQKIIETLLWFAGRSIRTDIHSLVKEMFYSDKIHLERYGRPVTGDVYIKMDHGPVASIAYDFLRAHRLQPQFIKKYDSGVFENAIQALDTSDPFKIRALREPDIEYFSGTDIDCMEEALKTCNGKDFCELVDMTHKEAAWIEAQLNGRMSFESFIDKQHPERDKFIQYVQETSECLAL